MSSLAYAFLTNRRGAAPAAASLAGAGGGGSRSIETYVNTVAALVPSEVLGLHAVFISLTTKLVANGNSQVSTITQPEWLFWGLVFLLVLSVALYVTPRILAKKWDRYDWIRTFIPPLALIAWTMLQRTTAFDAASTVLQFSLPDAGRSVSAVVLAVILGYAATVLSYKADGS